ncbi:glycosyltransferase [Maritimibacter sp. DP07]|uniref:Glycosyltransferase n=1 Tax=Maritimibacter harenae TaxID=2606218 RepID=A0A845LZD5_9RHOB|nr:glycosyltransferase family A protein [Maritimibacter harenae]MZR13400.1 glycosyltransferase [Maritimibacter harenae]
MVKLRSPNRLKMNTSSAKNIENVFVLCTGRCGSQTFIRACEHFTNYTAGHETRTRMLGTERFAYPKGHIEADNRLSWMLGRLQDAYGDRALYVHLTRDRQKVAESYDRRWHHRYSILDGYNRSILMQDRDNECASEDMVNTIEENITYFLENKSNVIEIDIDDPQESFLEFVSAISATGDIESAVAEFFVRHNQSAQVDSNNVEAQLSVGLRTAHEALRSQHANAISENKELKRLLSREVTLRRKEALTWERTQKREEKKRKTAYILAAPTLAVLAPFWAPWALYRRTKRPKKSLNPSSNLVLRAFRTFKREGADAAFSVLDNPEASPPSGTRELFQAIDAETDDDWLISMKQWAMYYDVPEFSLEAGSAPRFQRITFDEPKHVEAPLLVTVIIPCFNSEETVEKSINSILRQTWHNVEVIAVNDASTDRTGEIIELIASRDARVRVLHNPINVGPYVSKNRALLEAKGVYTTGHDADDIAFPNRIERQVHWLQSFPGRKATIGYMVRLDDEGRFSHASPIGRLSFDGVARFCPISMMCETKTLRDTLGGWDCVRFGADSELIERMEKVLGDSLVRQKRVLMFCLDGAAGLTNDPKTGTRTSSGLSQERRDYIDAFRNWHQTTPATDLYMPFPHTARHFPAPDLMKIATADIERVVKAD